MGFPKVMPVKDDFNPHLRVGGDRFGSIMDFRKKYFNPHLRVGGDHWRESEMFESDIVKIS